MDLPKRIKLRREELGMSQDELAKALGYKSRSSINKIELGINDITQSKIESFARALQTTPAYLMGWDDTADKFPPPNITDDYTTFPVIGEIAAGYDHIALESWDGDTVDIPNTYLKGRRNTEFFVLCVKGDSMYPAYQEGDKVLILKQNALDYSGQIGAIIYDSEYATLKKIEYKQGESGLRLVPINPLYPSITIENEELETCKIIGIPRLVIREVKK